MVWHIRWPYSRKTHDYDNIHASRQRDCIQDLHGRCRDLSDWYGGDRWPGREGLGVFRGHVRGPGGLHRQGVERPVRLPGGAG